jgi:hypothetical protein
MIKNFASANIAWDKFYTTLCFVMTVTGALCMTLSGIYYYKKYQSMDIHESDEEKGVEKEEKSDDMKHSNDTGIEA